MDGAGSSSSAEEGEDYDDEPVLKYQRMGADIGGLLSAAAHDAGEKETVVRMAVHDTCLVFGTAAGTILLTDYHGNETRRMQPHKKAVTDLSMDVTGEFLARQEAKQAVTASTVA